MTSASKKVYGDVAGQYNRSIFGNMDDCTFSDGCHGRSGGLSAMLQRGQRVRKAVSFHRRRTTHTPVIKIMDRRARKSRQFVAVSNRETGATVATVGGREWLRRVERANE
jgi:hypothetical protein